MWGCTVVRTPHVVKVRGQRRRRRRRWQRQNGQSASRPWRRRGRCDEFVADISCDSLTTPTCASCLPPPPADVDLAIGAHPISIRADGRVAVVADVMAIDVVHVYALLIPY
eukprot:2248709-Prymnesium_polylepis.1